MLHGARHITSADTGSREIACSNTTRKAHENLVRSGFTCTRRDFGCERPAAFECLNVSSSCQLYCRIWRTADGNPGKMGLCRLSRRESSPTHPEHIMICPNSYFYSSEGEVQPYYIICSDREGFGSYEHNNKSVRWGGKKGTTSQQ